MIWGVPQADSTKLVRRYDSPRAHAARGSPLMPAMKARGSTRLYLSVTTAGELRRGAERNPDRGDGARRARSIAGCDALRRSTLTRFCRLRNDTADIWGRLCMPRAANPLDKRIATTALLCELTVVTRNRIDIESTDVRPLTLFFWYCRIVRIALRYVL